MVYHSCVAECKRKQYQFLEGTEVRREESIIHRLLVSLSPAQVVAHFAAVVVYLKAPVCGVNN